MKKSRGGFEKSTFVGFRDYCLFTLLLDTGMRVSGALSLTLSDIDFQTNITLAAKNTKSSRGRYVPFSANSNKNLRELILEVNEMDESRQGLLFLTVYGNPLPKNVFRKRVKKVAQMNGIKKNVTVYMIRHTFAKMYLMNGGDMFSLQKILGHSKIDMVRKYVQFTTEDISNNHRIFSPLDSIR
ncbi:tyrosine-type recombinase/integrase [Metabacillus herbersteinensis]|uniref:Tyrosine-type recombinase/integrase n=1 Tax=Metabacillus herbersteinensis TaxID=283816 RepID=A0ABV6GDX1_9BACI